MGRNRFSYSFTTALLVTVLLTAEAKDGLPPVHIRSVEPSPSLLNSDGRFVKAFEPARFAVTIENTAPEPHKGYLSAEVVGNLDTVYGLPVQRIELGAGERRSIPLHWTPPASVTYDRLPSGPITVPSPSWGHAVTVAWLDDAWRVTGRGSMFFSVEAEGAVAKDRPNSPPQALSPRAAFDLRYAGYLQNPVFEEASSLEGGALTVEKSGVNKLRKGIGPSGLLTYLVPISASATARPATLAMKTAPQRLRQAWLLEPGRADGPRAQRLLHLADERQFRFDIPATDAEGVLVLEMEKAHYVPSGPLAEIVARAEKQFGPFPTMLRDAAGARVTSREKWQERRKQSKDAITRELSAPFGGNQCALEPQFISEEGIAPQAHINGLAGAYVRRKVSIQVRPGERINVWLLIPPGIGPFPAVLANHQTVWEGKDEPVGLGGNHHQLNYGPFLASRGFVVAAADSVTAGERMDPRTESPYDTSKFENDPRWSLLGQRLYDHVRVLDYLESLPFVRAERIGAIGHSLGGESTAVLAALDERIAAAVVSCPFTLLRTLPDAADTYTAKGSLILPASFREPLRAPVGKRQLPFDFDDCMALWAPRPVFLHGVKDDLWPNAPQVAQAAHALQQVYALHDAAGRLQVVYSNQAHCFPQWVQADAFDWLDYWLKSPSKVQAGTP